ncbi:MAG: LysE/ArgO family amino acid transporter [Neisseria sp.]|nr:LysE/ArgO family amino acid transporter [Neisseria sp.]
MPAVFIQGVLLMGSLIIAIGAQNAFVLKQGLLKQYVFTVAAICLLCDVVLATLGVFGMGSVMMRSPVAVKALAIGGALFLLWYGWNALRRALRPVGFVLAAADQPAPSRRRVIAQTLAVTLLNPHVYIDIVVIVGGIGATLNTAHKTAFLAGGLLTSAVWFFSLAYGTRILLPLFRRPLTWRILDGLIVVVMWAIAASLLNFARGG